MIVIKVGGADGIDYAPLLDDLAARTRRLGRVDWVLVHGASDATNRLQEALGTPPEFVTSVSGHVSRRTDARTLDAFAMASGRLNLRLVEGLQKRGVNAVGLTGTDGRLLEGRRKSAIKVVDPDGRRRVIRDDFTGTVDRVNRALLDLMLQHGYAPVVTVPAISDEGEAVNADADRAAAAVAGALDADALVILTNVPGLLRDVEDPSSLIREVPASKVADVEAYAKGRFTKKLMGAREALATGVGRVVFASANEAAPVTAAMDGGGTHIVQDAAPAPTPEVRT